MIATMTTMGWMESGAERAPPKKRGAPKGNRNAWKHGHRSAAAKLAREAARAPIVARLPDGHALCGALAAGDAATRNLKRQARRAAKRQGHDFLAKSPRAGGGWGALFAEQTKQFGDTSPAARGENRKRGAPRGNNNALKNGRKSAQRLAYNDRLRAVCRQADAIYGLASAIAAMRPRKAPIVEYTSIIHRGNERIVMTKIVKRPDADHPITVTPTKGRVVVKAGGRTIADSRNALTLQEANYPPVQYIPRGDVDMSLLSGSEHSTYCPYKGEASYFNLPGAPNAVWSYETPHPAMAKIRYHLAFYPKRVESIEVND